MDLSFSPFIVITVVAAIVAVTAYAIIDIRKNMAQNVQSAYQNQPILEKVESEMLLKDELMDSNTDNQTTLPLIFKTGNFRNYKKYSKEETALYNSASQLDRLRISLRSRLNSKYNLLNEQEYMVLLLIGFIIGGVVGWWATGNIIGILVLALIALITPEIYLNFQVKQYREEINKQAVALIQLVIQAMRTGLSIGEAFERAAIQLEGPIEKEIETLSQYFRGGFSFQDATRMAAEETASSFLRKIYSIIIMSLETNIAPEQIIERLTIIRKNLINEFYLKQAMRAEAGGGTLAKNILIVIVPGLLFTVLKSSPDMLKPLLEGPVGWSIIALGIGMYTTGIVVSNNVMKKLDV